MGLFDFFKKLQKSDVDEYYEQRNNMGSQAYNPAGSYPQNNQPPVNQGYQQPVNQGYAQPMQYAYNPAASFYMIVEDVFSITGRGTVVTGHVESGALNVGDTVKLLHNGVVCQVPVVGIEQFRKMLQTAKAGDNVGILLAGITKNAISKGDVLTK
ncbi:MAG: EF-Tu/IF-2/RF-3 family GTPase [Acutalibacteraceae bacterium]|nr:EF-Tu/IF-2/RF-3 family GTPase [Acutalibacteraceae bacterium]